jgi:hypothetical protein
MLIAGTLHSGPLSRASSRISRTFKLVISFNLSGNGVESMVVGVAGNIGLLVGRGCDVPVAALPVTSGCCESAPVLPTSTVAAPVALFPCPPFNVVQAVIKQQIKVA